MTIHLVHGAAVAVAFAAQVLRITTPYALASLGGTLSERAGVIALGLEGTLLSGAFAAAVGAHASGLALGGVAAGLLGGVVFAALYGLLAIRFRSDQIVCGVGLNLLAYGLTRMLLKLLYDSTANSPRVPGLSGRLLDSPFFWLVCAAPLVAHWVVARTRFGLRLRAAGDHPEAAASQGISVARVRWGAVLASGALAGLGGAWLCLANHGFEAEMSGGRGYIALAAVIMGRWRPIGAVAACLLFGLVEAVQINLQAHAVALPRELVQALPYLMTMIVVAGFIGRSRAPAALGRPEA